MLSLFLFKPVLGETLNIKSKNISIDKNTKISIFKNDVTAKDIENNLIKTNYAEFRKDLELFETQNPSNKPVVNYLFNSTNELGKKSLS